MNTDTAGLPDTRRGQKGLGTSPISAKYAIRFHLAEGVDVCAFGQGGEGLGLAGGDDLVDLGVESSIGWRVIGGLAEEVELVIVGGIPYVNQGPEAGVPGSPSADYAGEFLERVLAGPP